MSKICRALKNIFTGKGSRPAYATISFLMTIAPNECLYVYVFDEKWSVAVNILLNKLVASLAIFTIFRVASGIIHICKKKVSLIWDDYKVIIEYGNLIEVKDGMKVISFDECFTSKIGDAPNEIKETSVCGQYLIKNKDIIIDDIIQEARIKPLRGKSAYRGLTKYEPGTSVLFNGDLLMAFAKLDENGRAYMSYEDYLKCLNKMWEEVNNYHGTRDVYIPVLGSLLTQFDKSLTQQQLVDTILDSYRLSPYKLKNPFKLHIVCKRREGFDINEVWGVK